MRRKILTLALTAGMVLGGASVALAHPNEPAADPSPFGSEPLLRGEADGRGGLANANLDKAFDGIFQGFVVHAPTCAGHPGQSH